MARKCPICNEILHFGICLSQTCTRRRQRAAYNSGKAFAAVNMAVLQASAGKSVVFVTLDKDRAREMIKSAERTYDVQPLSVKPLDHGLLIKRKGHVEAAD